MVLKLAECAVHEAWEDTVFEVQHVCAEGEQTSWKNAEKYEPRGFGVEVVVNGVHEG
jgi:hypothetical protein